MPTSWTDHMVRAALALIEAGDEAAARGQLAWVVTQIRRAVTA